MSRISEEQQKIYILGLKARDEAIFKDIYNEYWSKMYISAFNVLRDRQQAEDVVQEVFSYLWNRGAEIDIQNLSAWLFTSVRYQVFNVLRSGKVRDKYEQYAPRELSILNIAEEKLQNDEIRIRLQDGIDSLPEKCREIFVLSRFQFMSHREIAKKLGVSEKTVENQVGIALKKLRIALADLVFVLMFAIFLL